MSRLPKPVKGSLVFGRQRENVYPGEYMSTGQMKWGPYTDMMRKVGGRCEERWGDDGNGVG